MAALVSVAVSDKGDYWWENENLYGPTIKEITPKIRMLCFVRRNSVLLNLVCVWILF